jgi:hypothetical protein
VVYRDTLDGALQHPSVQRLFRVLHYGSATMPLYRHHTDGAIVERAGEQHAGNAGTKRPRRRPKQGVY